MAKIDVNGLTLDYEFVGDEGAAPLVLTPGGRYPRDTAGAPELAEKLAEGGFRVLLWDRPGCGASMRPGGRRSRKGAGRSGSPNLIQPSRLPSRKALGGVAT